jgi:predicted DNA-binding transcriptional regulator YafY
VSGILNETAKYVVIDYTNHRGERAKRLINPSAFAFTSPEHPYYPSQWVAEAWDVDKQEMLTFALAKIHSWRAV